MVPFWNSDMTSPPAHEVAGLCFGRSYTLHMLHCTEVSQQTDAMGHVWTAPAVQEGI
jgi:hypothetical protein